MDCVGWTYQQDHRTGGYVLEAGRGDSDSENIIIIFMRANNGVSDDDVKNALLMKEED